MPSEQPQAEALPPVSPQELSAASALLDANPVARPMPEPGVEIARAFRQAAAVLTSIRDPGSLRPAVPLATTARADSVLGTELEGTEARAFGGERVLTTAARREALAELDSPEKIAQALDANPSERSGPMQALYERVLLGERVDPSAMSAEQLQQLQQILVWLREVRPVEALLEETRNRLLLARAIAPFEALAGDGIFYGRVAEMDALREYVGVLGPKRTISRIRRLTQSLWGGHSEAPTVLCVYGPGGAGKSSLIARFALEHLGLAPNARIPFVYLDFDRSDLDITDPLSLVVEMIRQVRVQRPESNKLDSLWEFCLTHVLPVIQRRREGELSAEDRESEDRSIVDRAISVFSDLYGIVSNCAPPPFVLVLDTFEEIQYRNEAQATRLWTVLSARAWPSLRVVVVGRAPLQSLRLGGATAQTLHVGDLDREAALAFLKAKGVDDPDEAAEILGRYGAIPLTLSLAATVSRKDKLKPGKVSRGVIPSKLQRWFSRGDEVVQGQLYDRILEHIHDPRARALAHPGLVLRRITPEIIAKVLNVPCHLYVTDDADAAALFDELRRETSLVIVDDREGALVPRSDLRRIMMRLEMVGNVEQVRAIHNAAVGYYQSRPDWHAQAEFRYHLLHLGAAPNEKWFVDPEVRASIQSSISDFTPEVQRSLLRLGFTTVDPLPGVTTQDDIDAALIATVEMGLPFLGRRLHDTYQQIAERIRISASPLRLCILAARVAGQMREAGLREQCLQDAQNRLEQDTDPVALLEYLSERCWSLNGKSSMKDPQFAGLIAALREVSERVGCAWGIAQANLQRHLTRTSEDQSLSDRECIASLRRLEPVDVWNLLLLIGPSARALCDIDPTLWDYLREAIVRSGAFLGARFDDSVAAAALVNLLKLLYPQTATPDGSRAIEELRALAELVAVWPYQILRVRPPYGSALAA
jgi:hypothetical protein